MGLAEFQRQVVLPNVPKLSTALLSLAEKRIDEKLTVGLYFDFSVVR